MTRPRAAWTPPARNGVSASRVAVSAGPWLLLADFLAARMPAVSDWPQRLARGDVLSANGQTLAADAPCVPGSLLWYWRSLPPEPRVPFEIEVLFQDDFLVAVDKPHFLPVTPGGRYLQETVLVRLKRLLGIQTLVPMHRLDRETAGVLLFTLRPETRHAYHAVLRDRQAHKVYEAIAPWHANLHLPLTCSNRLEEPAGADFMQMQVVAGEPNAETRIELLERLGPLPAGWAQAAVSSKLASASTAVANAAEAAGSDDAPELARYRLLPLTGRKHQLRVHLQGLGLPIIGDRIYPQLLPDLAPGAAPDYSRPLQLLAREIEFTDPISGQPRCFVSRRQLQLARPAARHPVSL